MLVQMKSNWMCGVKISLVTAGLLCLALGSAQAQFITFTDRTSFDAAAGGGLSLATFQGMGNLTFQTLSHTNAPTIPTGVTFHSTVGSATDLLVAPGGFNGNGAVSTDSLLASNFDTPLIATFSPNVTAVGTDVIPFAFSNDTGAITIAVHNATGSTSTSTYTVTPSQGVSGFFGIIGIGGDTIDQITFTAPSNYSAGVDNFAFGHASPGGIGPAAPGVPEPGSIALFVGMGVSATLAMVRRRRSGHAGRAPSPSLK